MGNYLNLKKTIQTIFHSTQFPSLIREGHWEYVDQIKTVGAALILAITPEEKDLGETMAAFCFMLAPCAGSNHAVTGSQGQNWCADWPKNPRGTILHHRRQNLN